MASLLAALILLACDSGASDDGSESMTATAEVASNLESSGIAEINAIIAEVSAGDAGALEARFQLQDVACTDAPGPGLPPPCRTAGPPGTLVPVFPVVACEDGWTAEVAPLVGHLLDVAPVLHSVVRLSDDTAGAYEVVYVAPFVREPGSVEVLRLTVEGAAILTFDEGCGPLTPPVELELPDGTEVILEGPGSAG